MECCTPVPWELIQAGPGPAPFTKGTFLQGLVFPVLSRFSTRARARPGQASLAGLGWQVRLGWAGLPGLAGLAPSRLRCRHGSQHSARPDFPAHCEIWPPKTL